jgi:hypothetical protein
LNLKELSTTLETNSIFNKFTEKINFDENKVNDFFRVIQLSDKKESVNNKLSNIEKQNTMTLSDLIDKNKMTAICKLDLIYRHFN